MMESETQLPVLLKALFHSGALVFVDLGRATSHFRCRLLGSRCESVLSPNQGLWLLALDFPSLRLANSPLSIEGAQWGIKSYR